VSAVLFGLTAVVVVVAAGAKRLTRTSKRMFGGHET